MGLESGSVWIIVSMNVGLGSFSVACKLVKLQQVSEDRVGRGQNLKHRAGRTSIVGA